MAALELHSIKPHNLYAVRDTALADEVAAGRVRLWQRDEYVDCLVDFLEELPGQFVIERLGGDAPPEYLVGPEWCLDKQGLRGRRAEFHRRGSWQGKKVGGSLIGHNEPGCGRLAALAPVDRVRSSLR